MNQVNDEIFEDMQETPTANAFYDCEFISCDFITGELTGKSFHDCCFFGCDLRKVDLTNTEFSNCRFKDCKLTNVDFLASKNIVDVQFDTCQLNQSIAALKSPGVNFSQCSFPAN